MNLIKFKNLKSPYILILIGPPLSGKSVFCKKFIEEIDPNITIISRDQIVLDEHGSNDWEGAFKSVDQKRVNRLLHQSFIDANNIRDNVIVDMTNLTSKRRRTTLNHFDVNYTKIAVVFPIIDWDEFMRRNKKRELEENKVIPEHVIKKMLSFYQPIKSDEGFDHIVSL